MGPHVRDQAARHIRDLQDGHKRGLTWDLDAARAAIDFYPRRLTLTGGKFQGKPYELHPTQQFKAGSLFGWKKASGRRRFRRFYNEEAKGQGKTPFLAGIALQGMVADNEAAAEIYCGAATKEQAKVLWGDVVNMKRGSDLLDRRIKERGNEPVLELRYKSRAGDTRFMRPLSRESKRTGSGMRPHIALLDELHEHADGLLIEMMERGFKWREQPLLCLATNAGHDRTSACWQEHQHAIKVAAGEVEDDETFTFVASLDEGDDPFEDESCWVKANPMLGVTVQVDDLRRVVEQARLMPSYRNNILRLHFCVWTESFSVWIPREMIEACEEKQEGPVSKPPAEFHGRPAIVSLDLGATRDLTARAVGWRDGQVQEGQHAGKARYAVWVHGYTPADTMRARALEDQAPYDVWAREGYLTATPGSKTALRHVAEDLARDHDDFDVRALAYDSWGFSELEEELAELGCLPNLLIHPQGFKKGPNDSPLWMPESIDRTETLIYEKRLRIFVSPVLRSALMSVAVEESPAGLRRFLKHKSTARIDAAIATVMCCGALVANFEETAPSYLETDEPLIF